MYVAVEKSLGMLLNPKKNSSGLTNAINSVLTTMRSNFLMAK